MGGLLNQSMLCFIVYATMRNLSKGQQLVEEAGRTLGRTLEIKQLDVCDEQSIKACVDSLPERRVDILSKSQLSGSPSMVKADSLLYCDALTFLETV